MFLLALDGRNNNMSTAMANPIKLNVSVALRQWIELTKVEKGPPPGATLISSVRSSPIAFSATAFLFLFFVDFVFLCKTSIAGVVPAWFHVVPTTPTSLKTSVFP